MPATETAFAPRLIAVTDAAKIARPPVKKIKSERVSRKESLSFWHLSLIHI